MFLDSIQMENTKNGIFGEVDFVFGNFLCIGTDLNSHSLCLRTHLIELEKNPPSIRAGRVIHAGPTQKRKTPPK